MIQDKAAEVERQKKSIDEKMKQIKYKIAVISGKGGVGKSSASVNIACALGALGKKCGLFDTDLHGPNAAKLLGIEDKQMMQENEELIPVNGPTGVKVVSMGLTGSDPDRPIIWRGPMKAGMIRSFLSDTAWGNLDYMIIDSPPGTGDEPLSVLQLIPGLTGVIIVTTPQEVAVLDARKSFVFAKEMKTGIIGVIENMSGFMCPHCGKETELFAGKGGEKMAEELGAEFLGRVPFDPVFGAVSDSGGVPVLNADENKAAEAFKKISLKIESVLADKKN
ncbi:MAG TPA: ATP-binding protein [Firmicutes bacterium]|nr:ATP-binding protein [Bacillota bacterium]